MLIGRVVGLAEVEVEIDRIERHDGGEFGRGGGTGSAGDQAADRDVPPADATAEWRHDVGKFDIELGCMDGRFRRLDSCGGGALALRTLIEMFVRLDGESSASLELLIGQRQCGRCRLELSVRLFELDLIRTRIDHEQQVALVHGLAVLEMDLGEVTAHLGAQHDLIHRGELTSEIGPVGNARLHRHRHRNAGWRHHRRPDRLRRKIAIGP
jgi:hypothetical protein